MSSINNKAISIRGTENRYWKSIICSDERDSSHDILNSTRQQYVTLSDPAEFWCLACWGGKPPRILVLGTNTVTGAQFQDVFPIIATLVVELSELSEPEPVAITIRAVLPLRIRQSPFHRVGSEILIAANVKVL